MNRLRRGQLIRVHLLDDSSVEGVLVSRRRRYIVLKHAKLEEGSGAWHELSSERLLIPHARVKLIEVVIG